MTVMATTSILFIMATTLMTIVAYQQQATAVRVGRVRAMHVADAGINAYLYQLRNDYSYYSTHPDTGWTVVSGIEKYRVKAVGPTATTPLTLYSIGVAGDGTQTIAATVRLRTFADYMFLSGSDLSIAGDADITGQVRGNGNIDNQGKIQGKIIAGGTFSGKAPDQGYLENQPQASFSAIADWMARKMRPAAMTAGTLFGASGASGYRVVVNGNTVVVDKITGGIDTGVFTTVPVTSMAIPPSGILYFEDTVWVQGSFSSPVTIVVKKGDTVGDIYLIGDFMPSSTDSTVTAGLVAEGNIIVPSWFGKQDLNVDAALMARTGHIYADIKQGFTRNRISIQGSLTFGLSGGDFGTVTNGNGQPVSGFRQKAYTYDQRLDLYPPPLYPQIADESLKVDTWVEESTPVW
jgi:hypothetical protein